MRRPIRLGILRFCLALLLAQASVAVAAEKQEAGLEPQLKAAIQAGDLDRFNALLGQAPDKPAVWEHNGKTALMYAAEAGNIDVVSALIHLKDGKTWTFRYAPDDFDAGIAYMNRCEKRTEETHGYTALMYASANGHVDVVNYLLNAGADPDVQCGFGQFTALQLAENAGHDRRDEIIGAIERKRDDKPWLRRQLDDLDLGSTLADVLIGFVVGGASISGVILTVKQIRNARRKKQRAARLASMRDHLNQS